MGRDALAANTTGVSNIAIGSGSLGANISGNENVAIGSATTEYTESAAFNVAVGGEALNLATTGGNKRRRWERRGG